MTEALVNKAKLAEQAERYEDMAKVQRGSGRVLDEIYSNVEFCEVRRVTCVVVERGLTKIINNLM